MNKIVVLDEIIESSKLDSSIKCELVSKKSLFEITILKIDILKDTSLNIINNVTSKAKLNIEINVHDNVNCTINEFRQGKEFKIKYQYNINTNSTLNIFKFYDMDNIKEYVQIDLNGENATMNYNFKTISKNTEKYDLVIYHNSSNTNSNIINNGVNINEGNLTFNVSSFVNKGNVKCNVIQNSRIINLTDNKCMICPNLYIDEYDVTASHSAHIGTFEYEELFYLMSRGIEKEEATYLLIKGFLLNNMSELLEKIEEICENYWR